MEKNESKKKRYQLPGVDFLIGAGKHARDKKYATFNRRMLAATIDSLLAMLLLAPLIDYLLSTYAPLPPIDWSYIRAAIPEGATNEEANRIIARQLVESGYVERWFNNFSLQFAALCTAAGICWFFWSATPGKMIMHIKIVDAKTEGRMSNNQIIMRLLGYVVSTLCLCIGFFWIGIDKRRRGWHDIMADTVVITVPFRKRAEPIPATEAAAVSDSPEPSARE